MGFICAGFMASTIVNPSFATDSDLAVLRNSDRIQSIIRGIPGNLSGSNGIILRCVATHDGPANLRFEPRAAEYEIILTNGFCAFTAEYDYGSSLNADRGVQGGSGNVITWRIKSEVGVFAQDINQLRTDYFCYIFPTSGISGLKTNYHSTLTKSRIGDREGIYLLDRFFLAMGGMIGLYMDEVTVRKEGFAGQLGELKGIGRAGGSAVGEWSLRYEGNFLFREGRLTGAGQSKPALTFINSGTIECSGINLATSGTFSSGGYRSEFNVLMMTNCPSSSLQPKISAVLGRLTNAPFISKLEIIDKRGPVTKRLEE